MSRYEDACDAGCDDDTDGVPRRKKTKRVAVGTRQLRCYTANN